MAKRQFRKGIDLVNHQKKRFAELKLTRVQGLKDIAEAGKQDAIELASGSLTPSQTRGAFARGATPAKSTPTGRRRSLTARQQARRGMGSVPLLPVNKQSGRLREAIRLVQRSQRPLRIDLVVQQVPYAKFVLGEGGTDKMVSRGYKAEVKRRQKARMAAFVQYYARNQRSI